MSEEDSPSMLPSVIQKDSRYGKLDIGYGYPKFFRCEAASNVWQLTQMMPLKLRNDGILESNNQISDSFVGSSFVRHPSAIQKKSSTLGKLLCELSRSAECMGEVPLFWMGLSDCHVVKLKEDKAVGPRLFKRTDLHLHFQRGMAKVWYGHVQKLWESSSVPVWIFNSCPKTNYIQQPVCSPYGCGLLS